MSVLKYFKNTPGRPPKGRQALSIIFFFKFATRSLEKKGGLSPHQRATRGACRPSLGRPLGPAHGRGRGACRPPSGDRGKPPYIRCNPPSLLI